MAKQLPHPPAWFSWSVWGIGALFYLMGFYQRVAPAVMTQELMRDFNLAAAGLGNLSAFYFYSYVAMQIPTGILADAWGPRRLLSLGAVGAAAGTIVFALSTSLVWAEFGRLLIGGSVAVAWVVLLKVATHWFTPRLFAMVSGVALLCGVLGAVTAGTPLRLLIDAFGWRGVMLVSGFVTLAIGAATWLWVRDDPSERGYATHAIYVDQDAQAMRPTLRGMLSGLGRVFTYRNTWLLFLAPGGMVGPVLSFAGLWGVPYLKARYGLPQIEGAAVCSFLMVTWAVGSPILGGLTDRMKKRKTLYVIGGALSLVCWCLMIYVPGLPLWAFAGLAGIAGFACASMIIGFAFAKESVPSHLAGTVSGLVNMGVMLGPTILQPAIGYMLDLNWTGGMADGVRIYDPAAFQSAFSLMIIWAVACTVLLSLTKETHCLQLVDKGQA
jgi:sugar phosphate permease